jgi:hypothetical protein
MNSEIKSRYLDNGLPEAGIVSDMNLESYADHHRSSGSAAARIVQEDKILEQELTET